MKFRNLSELFWRRAEKHKNKVFLRYKTRLRNPLVDLTWTEASSQIKDIAHGLKALGVEKGDNICLLSATCHYWLLCDIGTISAGACTVPIYHSSTRDTVEYIVNHSEAEIVFVRNKIQLQKLRASWDKLPKLKYAVVILDHGDLPEHDPRIITLDELMRMGQEAAHKDPDFIKTVRTETKLDDTASIIYTSGTTADPKGVILSHRNILSAALTFYQYVPLKAQDNVLSFLPLAHVFERVASQFYGIDQGVCFTYCEKPEYLPELLVESRANLMMAVPRILEKMHAKVMQELTHLPALQRKVMEEAIKLGIKYHKRKTQKKSIDKWLETRYKLAQKLVLRKIKEKIAPHLKMFVVGGAPMNEEIVYFFLAIGFDVIEGYGLTETSCAITVNPPWANKPGTVGLPFKHLDVKIMEDGEIVCKGLGVMQGYFKNPEATAEAIKDGWFYTGDLGEFDADGYLKITGRKKDLIITAAGKNVTPARVEQFLLRSKYLNQVVTLGNRERYLAALVTLNESEIKEYLQEQGIDYEPGQKFEAYPEIKELIREEIKEHSIELASYEQIKFFHILQDELSIAAGELTPTLKIKRAFVREKYKAIVQELFHKSKTKG